MYHLNNRGYKNYTNFVWGLQQTDKNFQFLTFALPESLGDNGMSVHFSLLTFKVEFNTVITWFYSIMTRNIEHFKGPIRRKLQLRRKQNYKQS